MKLRDCREARDTYSSTASAITRNLGYAGIAVMWMFRTTGNESVVSALLMGSGCFLVLGLAFDLLHYLYGAIAWGCYHRRKERHGTEEEDEFLAPRSINWPTNAFFVMKSICVSVGWALLVYFFLSKCCTLS